MALFAALTAIACDSSPKLPPPAIVQGPHGGAAYDLREGVGFAEVVNDPPLERGREETPTAIVIYFLGPDGKKAMTPAPTDVTMMEIVKTEKTSIPLKSSPDSSDPAGGAKFVSEPGLYALGTIRAEVGAQVEGKVISFSIGADR